MQIGSVDLHWWQLISMSWRLDEHLGHGEVSPSVSSSISLIPFGARLTIVSTFLTYFGSICDRCSGLINWTAYSKADFLRPARWHSITAEVSIGTMSNVTKMEDITGFYEKKIPEKYLRDGNWEMLDATWTRSRDASAWSALLTWTLTRVYRCNKFKA